MTPLVLVTALGGALGVGAMIGGAIALFNSWGT